jgi:hypothetical protein
MDEIDPRVSKLLGDLLALTLEQNDAQAEAALAAVRRRAARDGVTGGAIKHLLGRVAGRPASATDEAVGSLAGQLRDLEEMRMARHRAEAALARSEQANEALAESIGTLHRSRRSGWVVGFALGAGVAGLAVVGLGVAGVHMLPENFHGDGLDRFGRARLADYVRGCFLDSSNSLVGSPVPLHLLIDVDADGRITGAKLAPDQVGRLGTADNAIYGEMVVRTLVGGSCGALPLPGALQGRPERLDLLLPR